MTPRILAGRFELSEPLGHGRLAVVHRARDRELLEDVAVKLYPPGRAESAKCEIVVARRCMHPHVVAAHDFGIDGNEAFLTMEILEGGTLDGSAAGADAGRILREIELALAHVHRQGFVHGGVEASNILLGTDGRARLGGFGRSAVAGAEPGADPGSDLRALEELRRRFGA